MKNLNVYHEYHGKKATLFFNEIIKNNHNFIGSNFITTNNFNKGYFFRTENKIVTYIKRKY